MCLAIPAKVKKLLPHQRAIVSVGGTEKEISTTLIAELSEGDYIILHVGYALVKLDEQEAQKTLALFAEMLQGARDS